MEDKKNATNIKMDFHERVVIDTNALDWLDSPFQFCHQLVRLPPRRDG